MTAKSNAWRQDIQRLYFKFKNVNLSNNLGIDLGKFCETGPKTFNCREDVTRPVGATTSSTARDKNLGSVVYAAARLCTAVIF